MEAKVMHKSDIEYLVEETVIEQELEAEFAEAKDDAADELNKVSEDDKSSIIELRNSTICQNLHDPKHYVSCRLEQYGRLIFSHEICFDSALRLVHYISMVLERQCKIEDLFKNSKIVSKDNCTHLEYEAVSLELINLFKARLEKIAAMCNDCLYNDLYDKETLLKWLPILAII